MKGLIFDGPRTVNYESIEEPEIEAPNDVIVRVRRASICGSDLHPYHEREEGLDSGTVMGHEFVGEIVEVGAEVAGLSVGDSVYSPFTTNCGECFYCRRGLTSRCPKGQLFGWVGMGEGLHGGQAEYVRVPLAGSTLLPIPAGISDDEALLLGDVFSTAFFCAHSAGVGLGDVYAVIGCGPVGILTILAAHHLGAELIYAIDSVPERLVMAQDAGAVPINFSSEDPVTVLHDASEGRGADAVMEAVGNFGSARFAIEVVRPGGTISVVGVHCDERFAFSPAEAYDKNVTYRVGRCPARFYMESLAPVVRDGDLNISRIISHRMALSEGPEAYRIFDEKREGCTKVVLTP